MNKTLLLFNLSVVLVVLHTQDYFTNNIEP